MAEIIQIAGAEVRCPGTGLTGRRDLWIEDGILRLTEPRRPPDEVIEAEGLLAVPGFIEIHAHLREPGFTESETVATGLAAALAGGYTAVFAMANTRPPNDEAKLTREMLAAAGAAASPVRLYPVAAATRGMGGREPADYEAQREAGAGAVSDDGLPITDDEVMARAMALADRAGLPIFDHATHGPCSGTGVVNEGRWSRMRGLPGLPASEEDELVERDIRLSEESGHPVHICHISTAGGVAAVRAAKERGVGVTAEAAPHHLVLTDRDAMGPGQKMNPPLRDEGDRAAVVEGLADGTIEVVATDHAPHAPELKARGIGKAPFGVIGMESAFAVLHTELVVVGRLTLDQLLARMTEGPARIGRVPGGRLTDGQRAEVNLLDVESSWRLVPALLKSKSRNCPFLGRRLTGRVVATFAGRHIGVQVPEHYCSRKV